MDVGSFEVSTLDTNSTAMQFMQISRELIVFPMFPPDGVPVGPRSYGVDCVEVGAGREQLELFHISHACVQRYTWGSMRISGLLLRRRD